METEQIKDRISDALNETKDRVDGAMNTTSDKLFDAAQKVEEAGTSGQKAVSEYAGKVSDTLQESAKYLRDSDVDSIASELVVSLKDAVRMRPILSIACALGTGLILARILSKK